MKRLSALIITLITLAGSLAGQGTTAIDLMSKALYEENVNADFTKASQLYDQILKEHPQDKKTCAQATYRLGLCAEKLGQVRAQEYFVAVVEQYPDETDLVSKARAKLTNSEGIKYFTDERDGRQYKYVAIGKQYWMAENLAYMPHVSPAKEQGGIWVYGYDGKDVQTARNSENYMKYGSLYDWETAKRSCPDGWHLPTKSEWTELENRIGLNDPEANQDRDNIVNTDAFNLLVDPEAWGRTYWSNSTQLGFLPGGTRHLSSRMTNFYGERMLTYFWTASQDNSEEAWSPYLYKLTEYYSQKLTSTKIGLSVRCIRNTPVEFTTEVAPTIKFWPISLPGNIYRDFASIKILVMNPQQVDRVDFYAIKDNDTTFLGTDYQGEPYSSGVYYIGWDTRKFKNGSYKLLVEAVSFTGRKYSIDGLFSISNQENQKAQGSFVDPRDNQSYQYAKIGNQTWMAENLNYTIDDGKGSYCYNNLDFNCETYGRLYNLNTAFKACPAGWHLPSLSEWDELTKQLSVNTDQDIHSIIDTLTIGFKLKSTSGWSFHDKVIPGNGNGDNSSGFNALPGGFADYESFMYQGGYTTFWSSSKTSPSKAWYMDLTSLNNRLGKSTDGSERIFCYVRCIKD